MSYIILYVWQAQLCLLVVAAAVSVAPVMCNSICSYVSYIWWTYPYLLYFLFIVVCWIITIMCHISVAEAAGGEFSIVPYRNVYVELFIKYKCLGVSTKKMLPHELQQQAIHMAAYSASSLKQQGYVYFSLTNLHIKYEGDGLLYNPNTGHGIIIQYKTGLNRVASYNTMEKWLKGYTANTHLLSYGIYNLPHFHPFIQEVWPKLVQLYLNGAINMDCIFYILDNNIFPGNWKIEALTHGVKCYSQEVDERLYNDCIAQYRYAHQLPSPLLDEEQQQSLAYQNAQVIAELTQGVREVLGGNYVTRLYE